MTVKEMSASMVRLGSRLVTQSVVQYVCLVFVVIVTLITIVSALPALGGGGRPLYDHKSPEIQTLTDTNFSAHVFDPTANTDRIQLIQFYNSWCGHCIAFAPTFKQFAHEVRHWNKLVTISVVDCAQDSNTKLCRDMDINVYPTLKLFWFSPKDDQKGTEMTLTDRSSNGIQKSIISWIVDNWPKGVPRSWPDLMPVSAVSKEEFIKFLPIEKGIPVVLIVEDQKSFIGRQIILDLSGYQSQVIVLRMLDSSQPLLNQLLPQSLDKNKLPFMLTIDNKDYAFKIFQQNIYSDKELRRKFTKAIKSKFVKDAPDDSDDQEQISQDKRPEDTSRKESDVIDTPVVPQRLYMSDLNNALRNSLFHEVALKKKLNSTQLNALKNYLSVLELHFPFQTDKMRTFVKYLNEWLSKKKAGVDVDIDDMLTTMKIYEEYYHFPEMKPWKGCAGSDAKYRGYPCSVWTLFHTLTVAEYKNTLRSGKWSSLHSVLYAMRDYITNFFGCSYCAEHFHEMARDLESELTHPNSSVLWLWRSHNKVNKRLSGDPSEDPKHPKMPFPYKSQCPECYESGDTSADPKFNEKNVFEFLLRHYSSDNLIKDESELKESENSDQNQIRSEPNGRNSGKSDHSSHHSSKDNNTSVKAKWNYSLLNNMDYSLILVLYFFSAAIIVTLCVYLKLRVRRRGQKYSSLKPPLSFA